MDNYPDTGGFSPSAAVTGARFVCPLWCVKRRDHALESHKSHPLSDLDELRHGRGSLIVIDSQGDMIRTITHLAAFSPRSQGSLADRLVLIDPNDIEHPPCLNLFDFGLERLDRYSAVEREKLLNGAIALYAYMFGALLGAELTERQGVIFRYLGRLLMTVPGATIHTLREFMEDPEAARPHFTALEGSARHFFETQFASDAFKDTRQQILNRLWGILSNCRARAHVFQ